MFCFSKCREVLDVLCLLHIVANLHKDDKRCLVSLMCIYHVQVMCNSIPTKLRVLTLGRLELINKNNRRLYRR